MAKISDVKCNGFSRPITVDRKAVISWRISGAAADSFNVTFFQNGKLVHSSGRIFSEECIYGFFGPFEPLSEYFYVIDCFLKNGEKLSKTGSFVTALTRGFDNKAYFIGAGEKPICEQNPDGNPAIRLTKTFFLEKTGKAVLYFAVAGMGEVHINGVKAGKGVLGADFTNYSKSLIYKAYDVSRLLRKGENKVEALIGDGWYNQTTLDEWGFYKAQWRACPKLLLSIVNHEGKTVITSDASWDYTGCGGITGSALRLGEHFDARLQDNGFAVKKAVIMSAPEGKLKCCDCDEIKECGVYPPLNVQGNSDGWLIDFGQNTSGYVRIDCKLPQGNKISLEYGDKLTGGRIDNRSNSQYIYNKDAVYQQDTYIAGKDGKICRSPKFVYHGFRYIQLNGSLLKPENKEFVAVKVRSAFYRTGNFKCSDEIINKLYNMSLESCESNYTGFPSDCPHREKNGWTGDMALSCETFLYNYSVEFCLYKWLEDIEESQRENGQIPCIIPTSGWGYDWGSGPAWDIALPKIIYSLFMLRGDSFAAYRFIGVLEKYHKYLTGLSDGGLVEKGLGDWNYPKNIDVSVPPLKFIASCCYLEITRMFFFLCRIIDRKEKSCELDSLAKEITKAIRNVFIKPEGSVAEGGMTALAAGLYFDILPPNLREKTFRLLLNELEKSGYSYRAGILGVVYVNRVLCKYGRADIFLKLMRRSEYPSFYYWALNGATTLWEDFEGTNSRNHHMFSDIACVMTKYIGGISVAYENGKRKFIISPQPAGLEWFECSTGLGRGKIKVKYRKRLQIELFEITVPGNTPAIFKYNMQEIPLKEGKNNFEYNL